MSECCTSQNKAAKVNAHRCPVNGMRYKSVSLKTIYHQISHPWTLHPETENYYYCDDPSCDVVYFGQDDSVITTNQLRTSIGSKQSDDSATLCYCFGITLKDYEQKPSLKEFVTQQTISGTCDCLTHNPSGKCCLKDFPVIQ